MSFDSPRPLSKTVGSRPVRPRTSVNGLFKKPSLQALENPAVADPDASKETAVPSESSTAAWDGAISRPSTRTTRESLTVEPAEHGLTNRKSSAALREQIAKARAAKRAAMREAETAAAMTEPEPAEVESPIAPRPPKEDVNLGYGATRADPFNQNERRSMNAKSKILQGRVEAARTSGRLNVAAMGLKQIPIEVLKMYDFETGGNTTNWAESVDLTRFVAADNELETIDECIFPDKEPESFAEDEDSKGNIFGGLETLDLHGNLLISVPTGLRRLSLLTSLNLVGSHAACPRHLNVLLTARYSPKIV
jgi:hypothetical protein